MVNPSVLESIREYLRRLSSRGLAVRFAVLFGSRASGSGDTWSDIDLLVISPDFDDVFPRTKIDLLWRIAARVDSRIEPLPCGERQWLEDESTPIIETARREGIQIGA